MEQDCLALWVCHACHLPAPTRHHTALPYIPCPALHNLPYLHYMPHPCPRGGGACLAVAVLQFPLCYPSAPPALFGAHITPHTDAVPFPTDLPHRRTPTTYVTACVPIPPVNLFDMDYPPPHTPPGHLLARGGTPPAQPALPPPVITPQPVPQPGRDWEVLPVDLRCGHWAEQLKGCAGRPCHYSQRS